MSKDPDRIITGGTVLTVTGGVAEAVAVTGERITAVGTRDDILATGGSGTEIVDLRGATLVPGLIEPHTHPEISAQLYSWVDVSGFTYEHVAGVENALRAAIAKAAPGEWVFAFGMDPMLTPDLGTWNRDRLDQMAPDNPVVIMIQSMHTVFVNSAALNEAGVTEDTPDPGGGGKFLRDANGRLTGAAIEQPAVNVFRQPLRAVRRTAAQPPGRPVRPLSPGRHHDPRRRGTVPPEGARAALRDDHAGPADADRRLPPPQPGRRHRYHPRRRRRPLPLSGCEVLVRRLALLRDDAPRRPISPFAPLLRRAGHRGGDHRSSQFRHGRTHRTTIGAQGRRLQVLTHAQGDRGTREILDLYEKVLGDDAGTDHRWRLEHCALIQPDQIARARRLGVALSFHVNHVRYYGPELRDDILGPERADGIMPLKAALDAGHRISLHADTPMYPASPLSLMRTAVTRLTRKGDRLAPDQAITAEQALRAVTIDAAWQLFADDRIGSIEPGKYADFTVLERNPLEVPPEEIDEIAVLGTWLAGQPVPD